MPRHAFTYSIHSGRKERMRLVDIVVFRADSHFSGFSPHFNCLQFVCWFVSARVHGKSYKCKRQLFHWWMFSFRDREPTEKHTKKSNWSGDSVWWLLSEKSENELKTSKMVDANLTCDRTNILYSVEILQRYLRPPKTNRKDFNSLCFVSYSRTKDKLIAVLSRIIIARCWHFEGTLSQSIVFSV